MPNFAELVRPISLLMRADTEDPKWTGTHETIVKMVLSKLSEHMGLKIPDPREDFVLEAISTDHGYGGVLLQKAKEGKLMPVACTSTTNKWVSRSGAEDTLSAVLYSIRKFRDLLRLTSRLEVRTPTPGLTTLAKTRDHGARLQSVLGEILAYPVQFKHDQSLHKRIIEALAIPEGLPFQEGVSIKPTSNSAVLKKHKGKPPLVAFDGGYAAEVGSIGVQLRDASKERDLLVLGEYDVGTTNNEAECMACLRAL